MSDSGLRKLRKARNLTLQQVADGLGCAVSAVQRYEIKPESIDWGWAMRFANYYNVDPAELMFGGKAPTVQVAGYVGAGAEVIPFDDHAKGDGLEEVKLPRGLNPEKTVAVRVRGDSMSPLVEDGWLIFYSRDPEPVTADVLGKTCVVKLPDGRTLLKQVRRGFDPGRFNLVSFNGPLIENVELEWAAPVRAMIPPDLGEPAPEPEGAGEVEENGEAA